MEIIASIFSVLFIGLVLATVFTIGFSLLIWVICFVAVMTIIVMLRETLRRWWFLYNNPAPRKEPPQIIEGDYEDVSDK